MSSLNRQSQDFFEARYRASCDPWQFASSGYELDRYEATLSALPRARYHRAYEPGCSIGVLTSRLARRVEHLVACDIADTAVARAIERCRVFDHVEIHQRDAAAEQPAGPFDLIVFSEIGYYFTPDRLRAVGGQLADRLAPGADFLAVHWLGHSADHQLHGDEVHEILKKVLPGQWLSGSRHVGFRIDVWRH